MKTSRVQPIAITKTQSSESRLIRRLAVVTIVVIAALCQLRASNALAQSHGGHDGVSHGPSASHGRSFAEGRSFSHEHSPSHQRSFSHERSFSDAPFHTRHWVYDQRYNHDHFYPALGYSVRALPPDHLDLNFGSRHYFFHAGVWYQKRNQNFIVVSPPIGIIVPTLPPTYLTLTVAGIPYYYANHIYYTAVSNGYRVVELPAGTPTISAAVSAASDR